MGIQVANLAGMFEQGQKASQDDRKRGALAKFLQPARAGDKDAQTALYGAGAGAEAAGAQDYVQGQQKDAREEFGRASVMLTSMGNSPQAQQAYSQWRQHGIAAGVLPGDVPEQFDPGSLQVASAAAQAYGGGKGAELPTSVQEYQYAQKNPGFQDFLGAKTPQQLATLNVPGGTQQVWANPRTKSMTDLYGNPIASGGNAPSQPAPQPQRAPGEMPFTIDPSLPPQVQAAIRANEPQFANAPDGSNVQIPPRGGQPAPPSSLGFKPNSAPAARPQMLTDAEVAEQGLPKGTKAYRDGDGIVKTTYTPPAAKSDAPKELTGELKLKKALFENARRSAGEWLDLVTGPNGEFNDIAARMPRAMSLLRASIGNKLRAESGAAISAQEIENETNRYLGGLRSSDKTNSAQAQMLADDLDNQLSGLGGGAAKYTVGQVVEKGGKKYRVTDISDPNDPDVEEVR